MRLAPLFVVGFLAVHASFALPQDSAGTAVKTEKSAEDLAKPGAEKGAVTSGATAPTPRKLDLESNRKAGWCGTPKGPAKLACLGVGDILIATVGGEGGLAQAPDVCLDGKVVSLKRKTPLGGNRFMYEISSLPKDVQGILEGHQISLTAPTGLVQIAETQCSDPITQPINVAVAEPFLGKTAALVVFLALSFLILALIRAFPSLLKESDPIPPGGSNRPWSLGRAQLAWWTAIVFAGWFVILISTGNYESFTPEALILLGVSVATTATAGVVQKGKEQEKAKADGANNELKTLSTNLVAAGVAPAVTIAAGQRIQQIVGEQKVAPVYQNNVGFFSDLLKDGDAPSLARLQAVLWTVALGAIFVWQVLSNMEMPAFSKELLFLAGISSGSFLFGKISERRI